MNPPVPLVEKVDKEPDQVGVDLVAEALNLLPLRTVNKDDDLPSEDGGGMNPQDATLHNIEATNDVAAMILN